MWVWAYTNSTINAAFLDWSPQSWIFSFDEDIPDHTICSWIDFFHEGKFSFSLWDVEIDKDNMADYVVNETEGIRYDSCMVA